MDAYNGRHAEMGDIGTAQTSRPPLALDQDRSSPYRDHDCVTFRAARKTARPSAFGVRHPSRSKNFRTRAKLSTFDVIGSNIPELDGSLVSGLKVTKQSMSAASAMALLACAARTRSNSNI